MNLKKLKKVADSDSNDSKFESLLSWYKSSVTNEGYDNSIVKDNKDKIVALIYDNGADGQLGYSADNYETDYEFEEAFLDKLKELGLDYEVDGDRYVVYEPSTKKYLLDFAESADAEIEKWYDSEIETTDKFTEDEVDYVDDILQKTEGYDWFDINFEDLRDIVK